MNKQTFTSKKEKITLIRDDSEMSKKIEDFLKKNNFEYIVHYSDDTVNLPIIFSSSLCYPFQGEYGVNLFINSRKK